MNVSEQTLNALGFQQVRAALGQRCRTELGRERALNRGFLDDGEAVKNSLALIEEARGLKNEPLSLPIAGVPDVRAPVERASRGAMLEPQQLMGVTQALFAFERSVELMYDRRERFARIYGICRRMPVLSKLATRLDRSFEASGEISDRASVDLRDARERARGIHRRIRHRLDELLRDAAFTINLQESYYSVRNDRYVVPVKSSHQADLDGIVHNASQSGQTLFVEPKELIGIGNELAIAQSLVREEEIRVLTELSDLVGREASGILEGMRALTELDELEAAAQLANDLRATVPSVETRTGPLRLFNLRHPRLALSNPAVIANTVELTDETRALVVSGPNAGGKTVTLTGVGLCALMVRSGLPIPADENSAVPLFDSVQAAIGDQQDLQAGLSTFSAHVTTLKAITETARTGSLVLIDEIAADTDPREGAAIAIAVLENLLTRGVTVLVTTHLEELKALAHVDKRFVNARVGFDSQKMAPTYRLQLGFAGASSAIDIARRVGLGGAICDRAVHLATNSGGALAQALSAIEAERRSLFELRDAAERDAAEAKALKETLEQQRQSTVKNRAAEELKYRESLKAELEFARSQIRQLVDRLETAKGQEALRAANAASAELTRRINQQQEAQRDAREPEAAKVTQPLNLKVGARATHLAMKADVEILAIDGETITVQMGALKMRVKASELGGARQGAAKAAAREAKTRVAQLADRAEAVAPQALVISAPRLDVRGVRLDEAVREVERFLDRVVTQGEAQAVILHGKGTGAIRSGIWEYLKTSPYAREFRLGDGSEGGEGVTVVAL